MEPDDMNDEAIMAEMLANGRKHNAKLAKECGGLLEIDQVMNILNLRSHEEVNQTAKDKRLLWVQDGSVKRYPVFQFVDGEVLPGVIAVLEAIPNTDGWCVLDYLYNLEEGVGVVLPVNLIRIGPDGIDKAVRFARRLEE